MMIARAQESDLEGIRRVYRRSCPDVQGSIALSIQHENQMFVAKDSEERVIGMALVGTVSYGLTQVGEIYEVAAYEDAVTRALVNTCCEWVAERHADLIYILPRNDQRALLASMGFSDWVPGMLRVPPPRPVQVARFVTA